MSLTTWRKRYQAEGLKMLEDRPRSGRPPGFTGEQRAQITALACSDRPEGYGRWKSTIVGGQSCRNGFLRKHFAYGGSGHLEKKRAETAFKADMVHRESYS